MTTAIYPGSFDPVTNGHLDILTKACEMFDKVVVAVSINAEKKEFLSVEERVKLLKESIKGFNNAEVMVNEGLTVNYAKFLGASVIVRGVRNSADFEYENTMAQINHSINPEVKTVFLTPEPQNSFISSSMVRELLEHKADISKFVPKPVADYLS